MSVHWAWGSCLTGADFPVGFLTLATCVSVHLFFVCVHRSFLCSVVFHVYLFSNGVVVTLLFLFVAMPGSFEGWDPLV